MSMSFTEFKRLILKQGFFGLIKHAAMTTIFSSRGIANLHCYENGGIHGKMNLFSPGSDNVIWVTPVDIEVFWTEGAEQSRHFFRTKSGKDFEVTEESWFRIMHGNEYRR